MKTSARPEDDRFVSASEIASMFYCEQKIVLDLKHGETITEEQVQARARGTRVHSEVDRVARREHNKAPVSTGKKDHCFIATHVYGYDDARTNELRRFRDRVLMGQPSGVVLVKLYYRWAPTIVRWMEGRNVATAVSRLVIDLVRKLVSPWTGERHGRKERNR